MYHHRDIVSFCALVAVSIVMIVTPDAKILSQLAVIFE